MTSPISNNQRTGPVPTPVKAPSGPVAAPSGGLRQQHEQAAALHQQLQGALAAGKLGAVRQAHAELKPVVAAVKQMGSPSAERAALVARVDAAMQAVHAQLAAAPQSPAAKSAAAPASKAPAKAPAPKAPAQSAAYGGPLGGIGRMVSAAGGGLEKVGHGLFFPLEALGRAIEPARQAVGDGLSKARTAIDTSLVGTMPVVGQATRFATGVAASVVGMADGVVQAVTKPVDTIKGVGHLAGTVVGLVPGPKQVWDYAVHGTKPVESYKAALGDAGAMAKAVVQPALDDFAQGNVSGGLGRLTGDVGSLFLTGGASGSAKVAEASLAASRAGEAGRVGKLAAAAEAFGAKAVVRKVAAAIEETGLSAAPAAVAKKAKVAHAFSPELLAGEVRAATGPELAAAVAEQQKLLGKLGGVPLHEHLADQVVGALVDNEHKLMEAVKGLKLGGKPVGSMEDAAKAWKALPENAPERVAVAKKLAGAMQQGFAEGLQYQPAAVEFTALPEHIAGLQREAKVLLDPSLLNEDLHYLVDVMAEEQTHAYQRFLTENRHALQVDPKVATEVEKYAKELQQENYLHPPASGLETLANGVREMQSAIRNVADHADENLVLMLRKQVAPKLANGTPERALLDAWWTQVGPESEKLSFMKFAMGDLEKQARSGPGLRNWHSDYASRLPEGVVPLEGPLTGEALKLSLGKAIKESQSKLLKANDDVAFAFQSWMDAYKGQSLEFTAQNTAGEVSRWMFGR